MAKKMTIDEAIADMQKKCVDAITESVIMVEADAKFLCPVKTSTLKRSITHNVETKDNKVIGEVGTNVEYAYYAEKKKPYLEPAIDMNIEAIKKKIAEVLSK